MINEFTKFNFINLNNNNSLNYSNNKKQSKKNSKNFDSQNNLNNSNKNLNEYKNEIIKEDVKKFLDEIFNYCIEANKYKKISLYKKIFDSKLNDEYLYMQIQNKDKEIDELKKELNKYKYSCDLLKEENRKLMNFINFFNKINSTNNIYNNINIKNIINKGNININDNLINEQIKNKNNNYKNNINNKINIRNQIILKDENSNDFILKEKRNKVNAQINQKNSYISLNQENNKNKNEKENELEEQNYFLNHEKLYKNLMNYKFNKKYE